MDGEIASDKKITSDSEKEFAFVLKKMTKNKRAIFGAGLGLIIIFLALFSTVITPYDPLEMHLESILQPPNMNYLLGTDQFGRDILSRLIYGARLSLMVGIGATSINLFLCTVMGLVAGYWGGGVADQVIMRSLDIIHAFPRLLLALLILAVTGQNMWSIMLVLAFTGLPRFTRIIRGAVLSIRERDYILAARAIGVRDLRILISHILPNVAAPILILISLEMAHVIMSESSLSFLGFGADISIPSWGNMLSEARPYIREHPLMVLYPGFAIMLTIMAFNFLGDALRDILDPKFRQK